MTTRQSKTAVFYPTISCVIFGAGIVFLNDSIKGSHIYELHKLIPVQEQFTKCPLFIIERIKSFPVRSQELIAKHENTLNLNCVQSCRG